MILRDRREPRTLSNGPIRPTLGLSLRSSRQAELAHRHASHPVCAWMGNAKWIADMHDLQVAEADS